MVSFHHILFPSFIDSSGETVLFFVSRCIAINDSTINAQTTKISDYVIYRFCGFRENIVSLFYFRYPVSPELFSHSDLFHC